MWFAEITSKVTVRSEASRKVITKGFIVSTEMPSLLLDVPPVLRINGLITKISRPF